VDGPVTLSVNILVLSGDLQQLDVDYIIVDSTSAVFFQNGAKVERRQVPVIDSQMTLVNSTQLKCGPGVHDLAGAQILMSVSSNGVLQAPPIGCGVGISAYTCPQAVAPVMGGSVLSHAIASGAFAAAAGTGVPARRRRGAAKKKGKGGSTDERGGDQ
jgi:hypothetical protein